MKKSLFVLLATMLLLVSFGTAYTSYPSTIHVDCGYGYWGSFCQDYELQGEFNIVVNDMRVIYDKARNNEYVNNIQTRDIDSNEMRIRALEIYKRINDAKNNEQDNKIRHNAKVNHRQNKKISSLRSDLDDTNSYISENEDAWLEDHSGISFSRMVRYLEETFLDELRGIFTTQRDFSYLEDLTFKQQAEINYLKMGITDYSVDDLRAQAALLKMEEYGTTSIAINDYTCYNTDGKVICLG